MPKLLVFSEVKDLRQEVEEQLRGEMRNMSNEELGKLLEFAKNCKNQPNESSVQMRSKTTLAMDTDPKPYPQKDGLWSKKLPVEKSTGSFNEIIDSMPISLNYFEI